VQGPVNIEEEYIAVSWIPVIPKPIEGTGAQWPREPVMSEAQDVLRFAKLAHNKLMETKYLSLHLDGLNKAGIVYSSG